MDTPIFELWLAKPRLSVAALPQEQTAELLQKNEQFQKDLGIRELLTGRIISDERYTFFGIEWSPSWKAVREHQRCQDELHWFQHLDSLIYLGVEDPNTPNSLTPLDLDPKVEYLTHIFLAKARPAFYDITPDVMKQATELMAGWEKMGVRRVVSAATRAFNEEYESFGVELYPSLEVMLEKSRQQEQAKWYKYISARSYLGVAEGGELLKK